MKRRAPIILAIVLLLLAVAAGWYLRETGPGQAPGRSATGLTDDLRQRSEFPPAEVATCIGCHRQSTDHWLISQHARANRLVDRELDEDAFTPDRSVVHGSFTTTAERRGDQFMLAVTGPDGARSAHRAEAVIGVAPLRQYLVPFPGGRFQPLDLAYDPTQDDWFNMFGTDDRFPHEWGHWSNRGMNWNSQCAFCHMTGLEKNYDPATDTYATTWDAMGISCAQCHTAMPEHLADPEAFPVEPEFDRAQVMANCGSCHARREQLTGQFRKGERFEDHYRLQLPTEARIYYQDGQVRDEDFEYTSFLVSRMGHKGIHCLDCHHHHSGKLHKPVNDNTLCQMCHLEPGNREAKIIDPLPHSHHQPGSTGNLCIECHMPVTHYMVRDPRRDHAFTIPDPVLTSELGIPNACDRCHTDKTTEWSIEWVEKWYGEKMERRTRQRARIIARAQRLDQSVVPELVALTRTEEIAAWRATLVSLLGPWAALPDVRPLLNESLQHTNAMVRSEAVRALTPLPDARPQLRPLLQDPIRLVRLDAAWAFAGELDHQHPVYAELQQYLRFNSDQPGGALRNGQLAIAENRMEDAERWARRATDYDQSAMPSLMLGRVLHARGKTADAETALRRAAELAPESAETHYTLALLCGELGRTDEVVTLLRETVELDDQFGRAWYNLGLALAQLDRLSESITALRRAETLMLDSPEPAYARATVHARLGQRTDAREAALAALKIAPNYAPAIQLLRQLN